MIYYLHGVLKEKQKERLIIDVGGVGYEVLVDAHSFSQATEGKDITVFVSHNITSNRLVLYGFPTPQDRAFFELICSLPAIGPKTALRLLGELGAEGILRAVQANNPAAFRQVSGIGQKTASRLLVELTNRLTKTVEVTTSPDLLAGVEAALQNLGYQRQEIAEVLSRVEVTKEDTIESILRKALLLLSKEG